MFSFQSFFSFGGPQVRATFSEGKSWEKFPSGQAFVQQQQSDSARWQTVSEVRRPVVVAREGVTHSLIKRQREIFRNKSQIVAVG